VEGGGMSVLNAKIRGFRLIDVIGFGLLIVLILGVYLAKTIAGRERTEIAQVERQIEIEKTRIRLLEAEVAHLEQPARIEALATTYLQMQPIDAERETTPEALTRVAGQAEPVQ
jgi:cell division protein FtsL